MPYFNKKYFPKRILIAPLDWGLGHATRCIPIIKELQENKCEVVIAATGNVCVLLQKEFPGLAFLPLEGYNIRFGRTAASTFINILFQIPSILSIIVKEHRWLKNAITKYNISAVISDNRFGLYTNKVPCVYITHQLKIKTSSSFTEMILQKIHQAFIKKYKYCWVPDFGNAENIAGELSHPEKIPGNVFYIGCLSRVEKIDTEKKYDLLVMLSGPEPQRTLFENILLDQMKDIDKNILFVRGLPDFKSKPLAENLKHTIVNHLSANNLNLAIQQSKMVISRSGYTTVMDLIKLQQKAILIPTPGQTEQEYLAKNLMDKKMFFSVPQRDFSLHKALALDFPFIIPKVDMNIYKQKVNEFVNSF